MRLFNAMRPIRATRRSSQSTLPWSKQGVAARPSPPERSCRFKQVIARSVTCLRTGTAAFAALLALTFAPSAEAYTPYLIPAPQDVIATIGDNDGDVKLSWSGDWIDGDRHRDAAVGFTMDKYYIRYRKGSSFPGPNTDWQLISNTSYLTTDYTVSGLEIGETYVFQIRRRYGHANWFTTGPASSVVTAVPSAVPPASPTGLAAVGGNGGLAFSWTLPTNTTDIQKQQLRWKVTSALPFTASDAWTDLPGDVTGYRVMGLANGVAVSVEVRAVNAQGTGPAATLSGTPQDLAPSFGTASVADRTLTQGKAISALVLPEASGGDGTLSYTLTPSLPAGISLDMATRTVSGTPTALQAATSYSWTVTDADGDSSSLTFSISVEAIVAPSFGTATVADRTVIQNTAISALVLPEASGGDGTLNYALTPSLPAGLSLDMATRTVSGTPTAAQAATTYSWTASDEDGDSASLNFSFAVETDLMPSFGAATVADLTVTQNTAMSALVLPEASGGNGELSYALTPVLPAGLSLDMATRTVSGTPTASQTATTYSWSATDGDGDAATLTFTLQVDLDETPSFGSETVAGRTLYRDNAMAALVLPTADGGNGALSYALTPTLPAGLSLDMATRTISGTPTALQAATSYSWTVTDADGDTANVDFTIAVEADTVPSFGDATIADMLLLQHSPATTTILPAGTGGNGTLSYALTPTLPAGLSLDMATRTLSGTPTTPQVAATYRWTVSDKEGDRATLSFILDVEEDTTPFFLTGTQAGKVADRTLARNKAIVALTLPEASLGNGALSYALTPTLPAGLSLDMATRTISGTPTALQAATSYSWTATDSDGDSGVLTFSLAVTEDAVPSFAGASISDKLLRQNTPATGMFFPAATGGNGPLTYSFAPALPEGLFFGDFTRQIAGVPVSAQTATTYTYKVTDADGDEASLSFALTIMANDSPSFGGASVPHQVYLQNTPIAPLTLPTATGGEGALTYRLKPGLPPGLTLDMETRTLSGTPTEVRRPRTYTWIATDEDIYDDPIEDWYESTSLTFVIAVAEGASPSFGSAVVPDMLFDRNQPIAPQTLPAVTGGDGTPIYSLSPSLPAGLSFDPATRQITGTPTEVRVPRNYTYRALDADGDHAWRVFSIGVKEGSVPSFGDQKIADIFLRTHVRSAIQILPAATGGDGTLTYRISPGLPRGLHFERGTREFHGTPRGSLARPQIHHYIATDAHGDEASIPFRLDILSGYPRAPENLQAVPGVNSVTLTWVPSPDGFIDRYYVRYKKGSSLGDSYSLLNRPWKTEDDHLIPGSSQPTSSHTVTGLEGGEQYVFKIVGERGSGSDAYASTSREVKVVPLAVPPGAVSGLAAAGDDASVALTWTLPATPPLVTKLQLRWKPTADLPFDANDAWTELAGATTAHRVTGLVNATPYSFEVRAANNGGEGPMATVAATPEVRVPAQPANLTATASAGAVTLAWDDPSDATVSGYELRYTDAASLTDDDAWTAIAESGATTTVHEVAGLAGGTTYRFELRAVNASGASPASAEVTALTPDRTPTFGDATVADLTVTQGVAMAALTLPEATGGDGTFTYDLTPTLPAGLSLDMATRTVGGTPTALQAATSYSWTVTDADGDTASLSFTIAVEADTAPSFGAATIADMLLLQHSPATATILPAGTGGNGLLSYALTPALPQGLAVDPATRTLSGTSTKPLAATTYRWTVSDMEGDKATLTFVLDVVEDTTPVFRTGAQAGKVADRTLARNKVMVALTLPEASLGNGALSYALTPTLPAGLSLDMATRTISGTPTALQAATSYSWTATDADGDSGVLTFSLAVTEDAAPSFGGATVSNKLLRQNTPATGMFFPPASGGNGPFTYSIVPALPEGLFFGEITRQSTGVPVSFQTQLFFDNFTHQIAGVPVSAQTATTYTYKVTDADGDEASLSFALTIMANDSPSFGGASVPHQVYLQNTPIAPLALPTATGGEGALTYRLKPGLPPGLTLDMETHTLSGTPTEVRRPRTYTWIAMDEDIYDDPIEDRYESTSLTFVIAVAEGASPSFGSAEVPDMLFDRNQPIAPQTLPAATGGDGTPIYSLSPSLPAGLSFDPATRQITGTPTEVRVPRNYTYRALDADGDHAWRVFSIGVKEGSVPSFGDQKIADIFLVAHVPTAIQTMPAATGGDGTVTYSISPGLPRGLRFEGATRELHGAPQQSVNRPQIYHYIATDAHGDRASIPFRLHIDRLGPRSPENLKAVPGPGSVTLTWAPSPDGFVDRYFVRYRKGAGLRGPWKVLNTAWRTHEDHFIQGSSQTTSSHTVTGLEAGEQYSFQIIAGAYGDHMNWLAASSPVTATPLATTPGAVSGLAAAGDDGSVALTWSLPATPPSVDKLQLRWKATSALPFTASDAWTDLAGDAIAHRVTGLVNATSYSFEVRASNSSGEGPVATVAATPEARVPAQPANLTATASAGAVTLAWDDPSDATVSGYELRYTDAANFTNDDAWTAIADSGASTTVHEVAGLAGGTTYRFELRAVNASGASQASAEATALTLDRTPAFGDATVSDLVATQGVAMAALTLPEATDGDGTFTYDLTPALPAGLGLDMATRTLSGTPTALQAATSYSWTVTDADGDTASLSFTIAVEADTAPSFGDATIADMLLQQNVPATATILPAGTGGNGPLSYALTPDLPAGLSLDMATRTLSGTPTTPQAAANWSWTVTDADGDTASVSFAMTVVADTVPSFGSVTIADRIFTTGETLTAATLPAATGGNGTLSYSLTPALPAGLAFDAATRSVSGTTTAVTATTTYSYAATDADGDMASLTFTVRVVAPGELPSFGSGTIQDLTWIVAQTGNYSLTLPAATGGTGVLTYGLTPALPAGMAFDSATREVTGAPWNHGDPVAYTYTVEDEDGDRASLTFQASTVLATTAEPENLAAEVGNGQVTLTWESAFSSSFDHYQLRYTDGSSLSDDDAWTRIADSNGDTTSHVVTGLTNGTAYRFELRAMTLVGAGGTAGISATPQDLTVSFGDAAVADRSFTKDAAIAAFALPEASGGDGTLSYALTPDLPAGLSLDMATRTVSGTPTVALAVTTYSWTATDEDGDAASLSFTIEVAAGSGANAAARQAFGKSLAGMAASMLDGAQQTIGQRMSSAPGAFNLTLAGRQVEFGAASEPVEFDWRERGMAFDSDSDQQRVSWEEFRRDSAFEMAFREAASGLEMTAWGQGGLTSFRAEGAATSHDNRMETGWLGMDARMGDGLLMGFAYSRSAGETEASDGAGFTTALDAAWPYMQLKLAGGTEVWAMLGAGNGSVEYRPAEGSGESRALEMRLASAGGRQPLAKLGALDLALDADAGFVSLETGGTARSVTGGHEVQVWRARASLEAEHEGWGLGGASLAPFGSLAWRGEGGDWQDGSGVEAGFGARLLAPGSRFALVAEGRHLALSTGTGHVGTGASLTAGLEPAADGAGLSWSASLATGMRADGGAMMLADDLDHVAAGLVSDDDHTAFELEARYGFRLPATHGLLSPLLRFSHEEGNGRDIEAGLSLQAEKGRVDLELAAGHEYRSGSTDNTRFRLDLRLGF